MNPYPAERDWKKLADNVKRRLATMVDRQVDLWSGKRERAKRLADAQAVPQGLEPPK